jgi:hypothetical protein
VTLHSGLAAQVGFARETTYGTFVTPTNFIEFVEESISNEIERVESKAIRANQLVMRSDDWRKGQEKISGDVTFELWNKGFAFLLEMMFGAISTAGPSSGLYTHTFTPGHNPPSATFQVGRPEINFATPAVVPFTYKGALVESWELSASVGDPVQVKCSLVGQAEVTNQNLATASWPTGLELLTFVGASLTVGGTEVPVKEVTLEGSNGLDTDRYFLHSTQMQRPATAEMREFGGSFKAEFTSMDLYNAYIAGTESALVVTFAGVSNPTHKLVVTTNVRFDGETPVASGTEILEQEIKFRCVATGADATAISADYVTPDGAPA